MSSNCEIPCIICRKVLEEAMPGYSNNQPNDGLMCRTGGNYGSTVFDPVDGTNLYFLICDECMEKAGEDGVVMTGRFQRPVTIEKMGMIGWEKVDNPDVIWNPSMPAYGDECRITIEDLDNLPKNIRLTIPVEDIKRHIAFLEKDK